MKFMLVFTSSLLITCIFIQAICNYNLRERIEVLENKEISDIARIENRISPVYEKDSTHKWHLIGGIPDPLMPCPINPDMDYIDSTMFRPLVHSGISSGVLSTGKTYGSKEQH